VELEFSSGALYHSFGSNFTSPTRFSPLPPALSSGAPGKTGSLRRLRQPAAIFQKRAFRPVGVIAGDAWGEGEERVPAGGLGAYDRGNPVKLSFRKQLRRIIARRSGPEAGKGPRPASPPGRWARA